MTLHESEQRLDGMHLAERLRPTFSGEVLLPSDGTRYDAARSAYNAMFDRRPAVIARATSTADVITALACARETGLQIAVRGGGHSAAGYSTIEGGLLLDLGPMKAIRVDPAARRAFVQPGVIWGELDRVTQEFGLATTGGRMTTTGVAGFTLGSGSGWLERLHGLACDNLISAEVVTADGAVIRASEAENPELLWGLRGGGGNFGVVTEFEFQLHPVGPTIYGGIVMYPRNLAPEVCRNFRDFAGTAPREVACGALLMTAPPAPFVPPELQGRPAVSVFAAYFGDPDHGAQVLAPLQHFRDPPVDVMGPISYLELQAMTDAGNPPGRRNYWRSELVPDLTDDAIDALIASATTAPSPLSVIVMAAGGGAIADIAEDATAMSGRNVPWFFHCYGSWTETSQDPANLTWVRATSATVQPWTTAGMALNFTSDIDDDRVRSTFGATKYQRLVALKNTFDPDNTFRMNQNILPSPESRT